VSLSLFLVLILIMHFYVAIFLYGDDRLLISLFVALERNLFRLILLRFKRKSPNRPKRNYVPLLHKIMRTRTQMLTKH
jgi:hypothetical protein